MTLSPGTFFLIAGLIVACATLSVVLGCMKSISRNAAEVGILTGMVAVAPIAALYLREGTSFTQAWGEPVHRLVTFPLLLGVAGVVLNLIRFSDAKT
jgi:uncharacterized membrane protein